MSKLLLLCDNIYKQTGLSTSIIFFSFFLRAALSITFSAHRSASLLVVSPLDISTLKSVVRGHR